MKKPLPTMASMCATCPFRNEGWTEVRELLQRRALTEGTPICHSTGKALTERLGKAHLCRGARDFQLIMFHRMGFIAAPTDEAWEGRWRELCALANTKY